MLQTVELFQIWPGQIHWFIAHFPNLGNSGGYSDPPAAQDLPADRAYSTKGCGEPAGKMASPLGSFAPW